MSDEAVCRTAPATPGLLTIVKGKHIYFCVLHQSGDTEELVFTGVPGPGSGDSQVWCCLVYFTLYITLHCVV